MLAVRNKPPVLRASRQCPVSRMSPLPRLSSLFVNFFTQVDKASRYQRGHQRSHFEADPDSGADDQTRSTLQRALQVSALHTAILCFLSATMLSFSVPPCPRGIKLSFQAMVTQSRGTRNS